MMQPPRQIRAIAPRSMFQPYSALPAAIWSKPWEYATILEAYSACRTSSMKPSRRRSSNSAACAGQPGRGRLALGAEPDRARAKVASAIPVIGTPRSSAFCTVQRPVPFCSAWSSTMSTNALPVAASVWPRTSAVISIRNDSRSPEFQVAEDVGDLGRARRRRPADQVVRLGDQLHVGVLDAVVHHLHEVAGAVGADVGAARACRRPSRRSSPASDRATRRTPAIRPA